MGLLDAVAGIVQSGINARTQRQNTDKTIAANKNMAEYQYSKDLEMWNRGNVYNSPPAQMERLKKAGLNPNMVYGSGSAAGMAAGQLPKFNAPTLDYNYAPPVDITSAGGMIEAFQDFNVKNAQIDNLRAQAFDKVKLNELNWSPSQQMEWSGEGMNRDINITKWGSLKKRLLTGQAEAREAGIKNVTGKTGLIPTQAEMMRGQIRGIDQNNARVRQATEKLRLENTWFAERAISQLFGGMVRGGQGLKMLLQKKPGIGKAPAGIMKDARKWQQFEKAYKRGR